MAKETVQCPTCKAETEMTKSMYVDSGDTCYDITPNFKQSEEVLEGSYEGMPFLCLTCKHIYEVQLGENFWGSEDIPLIVTPTSPYKISNGEATN